MVFVSFLLNPGCRLMLENGKFAELRAMDAGLFASVQRLSPDERTMLLGYLRGTVTVEDYEQAA